MIDPIEEQIRQEEVEATEARKALIKKLCSNVKKAKVIFKADFERMKENQRLARSGTRKNWAKKNYRANIIQRHVKQRTASLYAKNPRVVGRIRERMNNTVWSGEVRDLEAAFQTVQQAQALIQELVQSSNNGLNQIDAEQTGQILQQQIATMEQAQAVIADYTKSKETRDTMEKISETLEFLLHYFMEEEIPNFKIQMKQTVRRAIINSVGYVKLGFVREMDKSPETRKKMKDAKTRMMHLTALMEDFAEGETTDYDAEFEEMQQQLLSLEMEPDNYVVREGLTFDFPPSDSIIVDPACTSLTGFLDAGWIAHEHFFTKKEVQEIYGIDLSKGDFRPYSASQAPQNGKDKKKGTDDSFVHVIQYYDKVSGLAYTIAEGHDNFLVEPAAPDVYTENFFPIFALAFNELEDSENLYPQSDVEMMEHMQLEYNSSRQAMREHRNASRPRYVAAMGALEEDEKADLKSNRLNDVIELKALAQGVKISDILQSMPTTSVDPNLYQTNFIFDDVQLVVGAQEANFGGMSGGTATESSIAESSRIATVNSNVDDLDEFLSDLFRAAGQICLIEMDEEQVKSFVGPGAMWPMLSKAEAAKELVMEIEAGSSGKPNKAQELANWERMLPLLIQVPGVNPTWLAKQTIKRMDENVNLDEAIAEELPSVMAINAAQKQQQGAVGTENAEGQAEAGADNEEQPPGVTPGPQPAFGDNTQ